MIISSVVRRPVVNSSGSYKQNSWFLTDCQEVFEEFPASFSGGIW
jgi:hypothetical protein